MQQTKPNRLTRLRNLLVCGLATAACLGLTGCGESDGPRNNVSGKVTFAGKPVPIGRIYFDPDLKKKNNGLQGYAEIKDGVYDTSRTSRGTTGGAVIVRIEAFDGVPADGESPNGRPLFPHYQTAVDLPKGKTTMDFDVPASAVNQRPPSNRYTGP